MGPPGIEATGPRRLRGPDPFRALLPPLCGICLVAHAVFLGLFVVAGVHVLAAVNVISVLWYAVMFGLVRRGRTKPIVEFLLIGGEVIGHAVLATAVLGWDSGFHYYLLLLVPCTAVGTMHPAWLKRAAVASAALAYLGLDIWLRKKPATGGLSTPSQEFLHYFNMLSALLVLAVLASRFYLLVKQTEAALQVMATTDPLTQLSNRNSLTATIALQHARAARGHPLSFIMCDIDHFKAINDRGGHTAGDAVLRSVSASMAASVRRIDVIGRWGGEEFLVVLPDAGAAEAAPVAERLRQDIAALPVAIDGEPWRVTVTIGVATIGPGESAADAIARADVALYRGKRSGRNQVVIAAQPILADTARTTP